MAGIYGDNPTGTFECLVCGLTWDGSELLIDTANAAWVCGDACCLGSITKISDNPKT